MKTDIVVSELKVGDPLFSTIHREVEVVEIDINSIYPIKCKDKAGYMYIYSLEGTTTLSDQLPSLFKVPPFKEVERVVMVKDFNDKDYTPRVLMAIKNKKAICWADATNIEDAKNETDTFDWPYWKEIEQTL